LGAKGYLLTKAFCEQNYKVIVIEEDENNGFAAQCKGLGACVITGDATLTQEC